MPNCLSPNPKTEQRKAMLYIPWINAGIQQRNQKHKLLMAAETATLLSHTNMRRVFKNINIMAVFKNKSSLKNLVVKTKI